MTVIPFISVQGYVIINGQQVDKTFLEPERELTLEEKSSLIYVYGDQYYFTGEEQIVSDLIAASQSGQQPRLETSISMDEIPSTTTALKDTSLVLDAFNGKRIDFQFNILYQSSVTTTGIKLGLSIPANFFFSATVKMISGLDGTSAAFEGALTINGDSVVSTQVPVANTTYLAEIKGTIMPSEDGIIRVTFGSEVASGQVTIKAGSNGKIL